MTTPTPTVAARQPATGRVPRPVWRAAWIVTAIFSLSNTATPLYRFWQADIGFSSGTLTLIFSAYIAGLLATLAVAGQLSDRLGRRAVLLPGLLSALLGCLLFGTAGSVWVLGVARFLTGIAVGVVVSAGMAAVVDLGGEQHKRSASLAASAAQVLGAGLGPLIGGAIAQWVAHPAPAVYLIEAVILASAAYVLLRLDLRTRPATRRPLSMPGVPATNRIDLALGLSIYVPGLAATTFVAALGPSLLARLLHVQSPLVGGAMVCLMFLSATGFQFLVKHLSVRTILLLGAAAIVLGMVALSAAVLSSTVLLVIAAAMLAGAGQGLGQLGALTLIAANVPAERRAEANSVLNIGAYAVAGTIAVATGFLVDAFGIGKASTGFAGLLIFLSAFGVVLVRRTLRP